LDIEFSIGLVEKLKSQGCFFQLLDGMHLTVAKLVTLHIMQGLATFNNLISVDGKKSVELEPVCISGRRRYKVVKRRKTLHNVKSDQLAFTTR